MHVVIFHYHLHPGGVTGVVTAMRRALLANASKVTRVTLVTGDEDNVASLRAAASPSPEIVVIPEIGYQSRLSIAGFASHGAEDAGRSPAGTNGPLGQVSDEQVAAGAKELADRIVAILNERFTGPDTVWWVHNHHLGKNPALTLALYKISAHNPEQAIVYHVHDFPECGRYSNLRFLRAAGVTELYPQSPNVSWVVINSRDKRILEDAGVQEAKYLPNPVEIPPSRASDRSSHEIKERLAQTFAHEYPLFDPEGSLLLYPVRSIRRKNIIEAGLLVALLSQSANLVVTLPGTSQQEKSYSDAVQHAYAEGLIPGLWGIGERLDAAGVTFDDLQHGVDAIVSSSVQEGFGFQYIAPLVLGVPLVARRLDIMDDVVPLYRDFPHTFYQRLVVPLSGPTLSGPDVLLRFRYDERLDRLRGDLPESAMNRLEGELATLLSGENVEFSYLPVEMQVAILRDVRQHREFRDEVCALNAELVKQVEATIASKGHPTPAAILEKFGPLRFTADVEAILDGSARSSTPGSARSRTPGGTELAIREHFAQLQFHRLLYG